MIRRINTRRFLNIIFVALVITTLSYLSIEMQYVKHRSYEHICLQQHINETDLVVRISSVVTSSSVPLTITQLTNTLAPSETRDTTSDAITSTRGFIALTSTKNVFDLIETVTATTSTTTQRPIFSNTSSGSQSKPSYFLYSTEELFKNLTKQSDGISLFKNIPEDEYLESNWTLYTSSPAVQTYLNYSVFISGEDICLREAPYLLVIIPSVVDNRERRDAIRRTWLRAAETNSWPQAHVRRKIKHIFLFGMKTDRKGEDLKILKTESILYNDIVVADFEESYRNLTIKILMGLKWVFKYCNSAEYALKVDEDTFINAPLMVDYLLHVRSKMVTDKFVVGLRHGFDKPEVVRGGKWGVTVEEYPLPFYPRYLYGHTYAISRASVGVLVSTAERVRLIAPEDAFITGILTKLSGIPRIDAPCFTMCCRKIHDCEVVWNKNVAVTAVDSVKLMEQIWGGVVSHTCNDTSPFN